MAFGSGVLISALSFELMDEAFRPGRLPRHGARLPGRRRGLHGWPTGTCPIAARKHRKRSGGKQPSEDEDGGSGLAIAVGALLDGIPESIVIGLSMLKGGVVSMVAVAAIFLSNVPEGLSSAAGMKKAKRSAAYIFGIWGGIAVISGVASLLGYTVFSGAPRPGGRDHGRRGRRDPGDAGRYHDSRSLRGSPRFRGPDHGDRLSRRLRAQQERGLKFRPAPAPRRAACGAGSCRRWSSAGRCGTR
jgi:hypothetical protein